MKLRSRTIRCTAATRCEDAIESVARGKCPVSAAAGLRDPLRFGKKSGPEVTTRWWKQLAKDKGSRLLDGVP